MANSILSNLGNTKWKLVLISIFLFPLSLFIIWKTGTINKLWKIIFTFISPITTIIFAALIFLFGFWDESGYKNILGEELIEKGNFSAAIIEFEKALEINARNSNSYLGKGIANRNLKNYKEAHINFELAIAYDSTNQVAYFNRAYLKSIQNNDLGAIKDYNLALKLDPKDALAYNNRGLSKFFLNDFEGAIKDYSQAINIKPDHDLAYCNRGFSKLKLFQTKSACSDFELGRKFGDKRAAEAILQNCKN